jgi:hypothetical protein
LFFPLQFGFLLGCCVSDGCTIRTPGEHSACTAAEVFLIVVLVVVAATAPVAAVEFMSGCFVSVRVPGAAVTGATLAASAAVLAAVLTVGAALLVIEALEAEPPIGSIRKTAKVKYNRYISLEECY